MTVLFLHLFIRVCHAYPPQVRYLSSCSTYNFCQPLSYRSTPSVYFCIAGDLTSFNASLTPAKYCMSIQVFSQVSQQNEQCGTNLVSKLYLLHVWGLLAKAVLQALYRLCTHCACHEPLQNSCKGRACMIHTLKLPCRVMKAHSGGNTSVWHDLVLTHATPQSKNIWNCLPVMVHLCGHKQAITMRMYVPRGLRTVWMSSGCCTAPQHSAFQSMRWQQHPQNSMGPNFMYQTVSNVKYACA